MTISSAASSAALQGIQSGESLLDRTAAQVANPALATTPSGDQVSLSSDAIAFLQAKEQISASVNVFHAESDIRKTLLSVTG